MTEAFHLQNKYNFFFLNNGTTRPLLFSFDSVYGKLSEAAHRHNKAGPFLVSFFFLNLFIERINIEEEERCK